MYLKKIIFIALFLSTSILFSKSTIGINVNDEDFEVEGSVDISDYGNGTIFMINANLIETKFDTLVGIGFTANNSFQGIDGLNLGALCWPSGCCSRYPGRTDNGRRSPAPASLLSR